MRRLSFFLTISICLSLLSGLQPSPALARVPLIAPCGAYQPGGYCYPAFVAQGPLYLRMAPGVPFIWFRSTPNSYAPVVGTETTQQGGVYIVPNASENAKFSWDGYQWWWYVRSFPGTAEGWVEQASITDNLRNTFYIEPPMTLNPATLLTNLPARATLRTKVSWAWLRIYPAMDSPFEASIFPNQVFTVLALPLYADDNHQYWYPVQFGAHSGWLEASSIGN